VGCWLTGENGAAGGLPSLLLFVVFAAGAGSELRKKGAAVEAVGWSNRVCWRKTVLLHGEGSSLLEEEETRGQRGVAGLCFWRRRRWRGKKIREATVLVCLPSLLVFGG
jgi:hypothetical protein